VAPVVTITGGLEEVQLSQSKLQRGEPIMVWWIDSMSYSEPWMDPAKVLAQCAEDPPNHMSVGFYVGTTQDCLAISLCRSLGESMDTVGGSWVIPWGCISAIRRVTGGETLDHKRMAKWASFSTP